MCGAFLKAYLQLTCMYAILIVMAAQLKHNCREELREVSLKATPTRLAVLEFLEKTKHPVDVSIILGYLQEKQIDADPATVFRIINLFTQKGLTKQIQLNESKFRYERTSLDDHHHLVCESCGNVEDISDSVVPILEETIQKEKKFLVKRHSLEFFGTCKNCQK